MTNEYTYNELLSFITSKYRDVFTSLYVIKDGEDPDEVFDEHLLYYLFDKNYLVIMEDEGRPHIFLGSSSASGGWDRYGMVRRGLARYPDQRFSTETKIFDENNSVVIYARRDKQSIVRLLWQYMTEIASILFIEQSNLRLSNVKAIIQATTSTATTMENIFNEMFMSSKSYIVSKRKAEDISNTIEKIDLDVEYIAEKYQASMLFYHNQILEMLGVNFTPHEKKERLVTNEVDSNNELTQSQSNKTLRRMQRYIKKINDLFETDFTIEKSEVVIENDQEVEEVKEKKEGDNDEL